MPQFHRHSYLAEKGKIFGNKLFNVTRLMRKKVIKSTSTIAIARVIAALYLNWGEEVCESF
jgi:hypothetical protein